MKKSELLVSMTLPGTPVDVRNIDGKVVVTVALPVDIDPVKILNEEADKRLTAGLDNFAADLLVERIGGFALTESLRARVRMSGITLRTIEGKQ